MFKLSPFGSLVDGTLNENSNLYINFTIDNSSLDYIELKKDIRKALIESSDGSERYVFLQESNVY